MKDHHDHAHDHAHGQAGETRALNHSLEPEHHAAIWETLGTYEAWLTTAERVAEGARPMPLDVKPLLVLTGNPDAQQAFCAVLHGVHHIHATSPTAQKTKPISPSMAACRLAIGLEGVLKTRFLS